MSIINFSNKLWYMSIPDSSTTIDLGGFTTDSEGEQQLSHIKVLFYLTGDFNRDAITLSIINVASPSYTLSSDPITIKKDVGQEFSSGASWLGWLRFDFSDNFWLYDSSSYTLHIDASNYPNTSGTTDSDVGLVFDYPIPMNGTRQEGVFQHPIAFQIFGKKDN